MRVWNKIWRNFAKNSRRSFSNCSNNCSKNDKGNSLKNEPSDDLYLNYLKEEFLSIYSTNYENKVNSFATAKGTKIYSLRKEIGNITFNPSFKIYKYKVSNEHFRKPYRDDLTISSIGIGSYLGAPDEVDDLKVKIDLILDFNKFVAV